MIKSDAWPTIFILFLSTHHQQLISQDLLLSVQVLLQTGVRLPDFHLINGRMEELLIALIFRMKLHTQ